jgi:hypothetical protein
MNRRGAARAARPQLRTLVPSFGALLIGMNRPARRAQRAHNHAVTRLASLNRTCQNLENSHSVPHPARAARQQLSNHRTSLLHRTRRNTEIQSLGTAPVGILKYSHSVPHPSEFWYTVTRYRTRQNLEIQSFGAAPGKILEYSHSVSQPTKVRSTLRAQSAFVLSFFSLKYI